MSKKKQPPARPTAGLSSLRPRLDALFQNDQFVYFDQAQVFRALDDLCQGIKPADFVPVLIAAFQDAPDAARQLLDDLLPTWLAERGHLAALRDAVERQQLNDAALPQALQWLTAAGTSIDDLIGPEGDDSFYQAFTVGNEMQSSVMIYWYTNQRKQRVCGLGILIDTQPPWDGATKDAFRTSQLRPDEAIQDYIALWAGRGQTPQAISAAEAKRIVITALLCNHRNNIRLHSDLASARREFVQYVLPLEDAPDTPPFSATDFDELARTGRQAEALMREEQLFGYQTRMPDGKIIRIIRPLDDDDY
jgi:hypothetical protein